MRLIKIDIVERFQLFVFMVIITLRNYTEFSGYMTLSSLSSHIEQFIQSFESISTMKWSGLLFKLYEQLWIFSNNWIQSTSWKMLQILMLPLVMVVGTEVIVDWLKHAFITKFNLVKPDVYKRYFHSLCKDLCPETQEVIQNVLTGLSISLIDHQPLPSGWDLLLFHWPV